jgi:hypothetical protein
MIFEEESRLGTLFARAGIPNIVIAQKGWPKWPLCGQF